MAFAPLRILGLLLAIFHLSAAICGAQTGGISPAIPRMHIYGKYLSGTVRDALGRPIPNATLTITSRDGKISLNLTADDSGIFRLKEPGPGIYSITASGTDFSPATTTVVLPQRMRKRIEITLQSKQALNLPLLASRIRAQNGLSPTATSKYTLTSKDITNLPEGQATPLNEVMLQMPGVALDQNQETHIRGEHMGIQYQMNGILLAAGYEYRSNVHPVAELLFRAERQFARRSSARAVRISHLRSHRHPHQGRMRWRAQRCDDLRWAARYSTGQFSARRMQRRTQLLPDGHVSTVEFGFQLRGIGARSNSRRSHPGAGFRLSDLCPRSSRETKSDFRNDASVQSVSQPARICRRNINSTTSIRPLIRRARSTPD